MKSQILNDMTAEPISISDDVTLSDAQDIMRSWGMRHLPVMTDAKLVGVISDRDILRAFSLHKPGTTTVGAVMSKNPYKVNQHVNIGQVASVMAENKFGCAIVTDDKEKIVGIFTTVDALKLLARITSQPNEIDLRALQLREYLKQQKRAS